MLTVVQARKVVACIVMRTRKYYLHQLVFCLFVSFGVDFGVAFTHQPHTFEWSSGCALTYIHCTTAELFQYYPCYEYAFIWGKERVFGTVIDYNGNL